MRVCGSRCVQLYTCVTTDACGCGYVCTLLVVGACLCARVCLCVHISAGMPVLPCVSDLVFVCLYISVIVFECDYTPVSVFVRVCLCSCIVPAFMYAVCSHAHVSDSGVRGDASVCSDVCARAGVCAGGMRP